MQEILPLTLFRHAEHAMISAHPSSRTPCVQGNVILADHKYEVLTLLRSHRDDNKDLAIMARHPYPMHAIRLREPVSKSALSTALAAPAAAAAAASEVASGDAAAATAGAGNGLGGMDADGDGYNDDTEPAAPAAPAAAAAGGVGGGGKGGKKGKKGDGSNAATSLKTCIGQVLPYGPTVVEHVVKTAGLSPARCVVQQPLEAAEVAALHGALQQLDTWFASLEEAAPAGYITAIRVKGSCGKSGAATPGGGAAGGKQGKGQKEGRGGSGEDGQKADQAAGEGKEQQQQEQDDGPVWVYQDFNGFRLAQASGLPRVGVGEGAGEVSGGAGAVLEFECFDEALDEFYSKVREGLGTGADFATSLPFCASIPWAQR
jgi:hypothetical protein